MAVIFRPLNMSPARVQILAEIVMQLAELAMVPQLISALEALVQLIMFMMVTPLQQIAWQFQIAQVQDM